MTRPGLFLVIENDEDVDDSSQSKMLATRLINLGYGVEVLDFPRNNDPSSFFIKEYLNDRYGKNSEVNPYTGSLFYALDRFQATNEIKSALQSGKIVLARGFTGFSMAQQGSKLSHPEQRRGFYIWLDNLEYQTLGIPRPDTNIILRKPHGAHPPNSESTDKFKTMVNTTEVYDDLCELFPKDYKRFDCARDNKLLDQEIIHEQLWQTINPLLPEVVTNSSLSANVAKKSNPFIQRTESGFNITTAGENFLKEAITNTSEGVYAFTDKLSPLTIAASMARLSRRGDDLRITLLDEFADSLGKDEKLLHRVITAYGDDSVQQLAGQHFVVEGASNLLTKKLEWGRMGSYLEQSTRYIYLDQKDKFGNYKYYVPKSLDETTNIQYRKTMDYIFSTYSNMVRKLTTHVRAKSRVSKAEQDIAWQGATRAQACDAIRPVLPVATKLTVGVFASGQALESLIMHLLSDELIEARETGQKILDETRKVIPTFLERADKPSRGGATIAYQANTKSQVRDLAHKHLSEKHSNSADAVNLVSYWPRNELTLIADMLYEHSNLSLQDISKEVEKWPIALKEEVFNAYMGERLNRRHKPGRAIEKAHYSWDVMCDFGIFRELQRHRMVDDLQWQILTPRFGFEIPDLVEEAGLTEQFESCFDTSLQLHSLLQSRNHELEAQYATLLGHKMRWKVTYNAREAFHLHELRSSPQAHPACRKLIKEMHEKVREVHPMLADAMKFVNKDEDEELTRLAAERYTQFKLKNLKA